jgi:peroxiredoxin Q/BCP
MTAETAPQPMPRVGDEAPDFTLTDDTGRPRTLSEQRGHWVLLFFYPKDDTPGCTREACALRDADPEMRAMDARTWGISILSSGSKAAFKAKYGLPFTLLADEDHRVAEAYGAWSQKTNYGKTYWGVQRASFLVDPSGRLARVWPKVDPDSHAADVLAALGETRSAPDR